jgi:hypothetical protein
MHESIGRTNPDKAGIPVARQETGGHAGPPERLGEVVKKLYPDLNDTERNLASANLVRYFEIALAIAEEKEQPDAPLTHPYPVSSMKERSNVNLKN